MKWMIIVILELLYLLFYYFMLWIYKSDDRMVWCNDYDVIETLHGEKRLEYIELSKRLIRNLMLSFMIMTLLGVVLDLWIVILITILLSIYFIYRDFKLRKSYTA